MIDLSQNAVTGSLPLSGLRIGQLTASASRLGGGVSEAVVKQTELIRALGGKSVVVALDDVHAHEDAARLLDTEVHLASVSGPRMIGFAPGLIRALEDAKLDLLHLHGIWMYPSRAGAIWAKRTGKPYIVSPHGMLDPWITGRGRVKKSLARIAYERANWRAATTIHALTVREAQDIERETGRVDSLVIPNAGPSPAIGPARVRSQTFLYLGRIHPKKNIDSLIAAWTQRAAAVRAAGGRLVIAGWGQDAHVSQLRAVLAGAPDSITFVGPLYGEAKERAYGDARFFVLPSHSEGLPMVILEAWAAGTPALMTTECNLPGGYTAGAAIDCGFDPGTIGVALDRAMAMTESEWAAMSGAATALIQQSFSTRTVSEHWSRAYRAMAGRATLDLSVS